MKLRVRAALLAAVMACSLCIVAAPGAFAGDDAASDTSGTGGGSGTTDGGTGGTGTGGGPGSPGK